MNDTVQLVLVCIGGLLVVWIPTFGITYFVMSSRHKKRQQSSEEVGADVAAAGAVSLGIALLVSVAALLVIGVCVVVAVFGFIAIACGGH